MQTLSTLFLLILFCGAVAALWHSIRPRKPGGGKGAGRGERPPTKEV